MKKQINFDLELGKLSLMHFFLSLFFLSPVAVFFYKQRGLDFMEILALESVLALFIFLFEVPTGVFADKFGRKKSIISGIVTFFLATLLMFFARGFMMFAVIFALTGIAVTFMTGSVEALIYDALKRENKSYLMKKAMGNYGSSSLMGKFVAPVIGSYIARDLLPVNFNVLIYFTLASVITAFIIALTIKDTEEREILRKNPSPVTILSEGIRMIRENRSLARIISLGIFTSPFLFTFKYLSQQNLKDSGIDVPFIGLVFALSLLFSAAAQKYAYWFENFLGMKKAIFTATILPGILYISMAFISNSAWLIISFVLVRVFDGFGGPLFSEYRNIHIPSANRTTMISLSSMLGCFYLMFARIIIGKLAGMELNYAFIFMGTVIIGASLFLRLDETHVKLAEPVYARV